MATLNEIALRELDISRTQVLLNAWGFYHLQWAVAISRAESYEKRLAAPRKKSPKRRAAFEQVLKACRLDARNCMYVMRVLEKAIGRKPKIIKGGDII